MNKSICQFLSLIIIIEETKVEVITRVEETTTIDLTAEITIEITAVTEEDNTARPL